MAVLSTKGQIVIPERIRTELALGPGTDIAVERLDDTILLIPRPENPVEALCGMLKGMFDEDAVTLVRRMRDEDIEKDKRKPWRA
jgi:AbrB family looped-hinge helix DNA binding protein